MPATTKWMSFCSLKPIPRAYQPNGCPFVLDFTEKKKAGTVMPATTK